jgi:hypothetical protein
MSISETIPTEYIKKTDLLSKRACHFCSVTPRIGTLSIFEGQITDANLTLEERDVLSAVRLGGL